MYSVVYSTVLYHYLTVCAGVVYRTDTVLYHYLTICTGVVYSTVLYHYLTIYR